MRNKKKRRKLLTGTPIEGYIEDPNNELYKDKLNKAKARQEAEADPFLTALQIGGTMIGNIAGAAIGVPGLSTAVNGITNVLGFGGTSDDNPEVEGGEVAETPDGRVFEFKGRKHEEGGIPTSLPQGTDVFSDRLKIKGESLAQRKIKREKRANKLLKLMESNPDDAIIKKTYKKIVVDNAKEEQKDKKLQTVAGKLFNAGKNQYPYGTPMSEEDWMDQYGLQYGDAAQSYYEQYKNRFISTPEKIPATWEKPQSTDPNIDPLASNSQLNPRDIKNNSTSSIKFPDVADGDVLGFIGQGISAFGGYFNTLEERANDVPNINPYENFGKDALATLNESEVNLKKIKAAQERDLNIKRTTAIKRGRNNSRSVNTMRMLNLMADAAYDKADAKLIASTTASKIKIANAKAQIENQQDAYTGKGKLIQDMNNKKDQDAYYTALRHDIENIGFGLQNMGKATNDVKIKERQMEAINKLASLVDDRDQLMAILELFSFDTSTTKTKKS